MLGPSWRVLAHARLAAEASPLDNFVSSHERTLGVESCMSPQGPWSTRVLRQFAPQ